MKNVKRVLALLLVIALVASNAPMTVTAVTTNADGYIEIRTIEDLYNIRDDLTANYILMNDIDLTAATASGGVWDYEGRGWNPIGSNDVYSNGAFSGIFDGNGYSITGLRINVTTLPGGTGTVYLGLFANVTGTVKNLTVGGNITYEAAMAFYIGSVAGTCSGTVTNCKNNAKIAGTAAAYNINGYVGGIVGAATGNASISTCVNTGRVASYSASVSSTFCDGDVNCAGGIAGIAADTVSVSQCYNIGDVSARSTGTSGSYVDYTGYAYAYGIAPGAIISDCYNTGAVTASRRAGYGYTYAYGIGGKTVSRCYNMGTISAGTASAQIVSTSNTAVDCYFLGTSTSQAGVTALNAAQTLIQSMYKGFDFETVWVINPAAVYPYPQLQANEQDLRVATGIEVTALPTKTTYIVGENLVLTGLKVSLVLQDGSREAIAVTADMVTGYDATTPGVQTLTVKWNDFTTTFTVEVNEEQYTPIYDVEDLYNIRYDLTGKYLLMNDIDLTEALATGGAWNFEGRGWNPIGSNDIYSNGTFSGILDGNGYSITGMRINVTTLPSGTGTSVYLGLFAKVSGTVKNLSLSGTINTSWSSSKKTLYVGSIAGYCTGTISNCRSNMEITASSTYSYDDPNVYAGGLVGYVSGATISGSVNLGSVSARVGLSDDSRAYAYAGGLVGYAYDSGTKISNSYNVGPVTATAASSNNQYYYAIAYAAGIVNNAGTILNCYNAAEVVATHSGTYSYYSDYAYGIGGSSITDCYNVGAVKGSSCQYAVSAGTLTNCYYLAGVGTTYTGAVSLNETQALMQAMYAGFDFETVWIQNPDANYPYPQLRNNVQDLNETATVVSIISLPEKLEYFVGDALVLDGCMINVFFKSGRSELMDVTADMISGFDPNTVGEQTVTVTFRNASDTFTVTVKERPEITGVELLSGPAKTEFVVGTAFDFSGAKAKVSYSTGETELVDITVDMTTGGNIHHLGKQTITATVYDQTLTFDITVIAVAVGSLRIESMPNKLTYIEGQELDLTGLKLVAVMNNGNQSEVTTGYTVSGYKNTIGVHTVTITYKGKTASFDVTVKARAAVALELRAEPNKTEYVSGQKLDTTGMVIIAVYDNGDTALLEEYTISGFSTLPGIHTITVSSGELSVAFTVTVLARTVSKLEILNKPAKLTYLENDEFDPTGMVVQVTYNDGDTAIVTEYDVIGYSALPGTYTLSVVYDGLIDTFDVTVKAKELTNLVVTPPTKLYYELNEEFDPTGMKVVACYNNGEQAEVLGYTVTGFDSKTPGLKTIIISYCGKLSQFNVSVAKRNEIQTNGSFIVGNPAARPGEQVRIPVTVSGNVGIAGMQHTITFKPNDLTFMGIEMSASFGGTLVLNEDQVANGIVDLVWFSATEVKADGVAYEIVFQIKDNATGGNSAVGIDFSVNDNANLRGDNLVFAAVNGSVDILNYWLGDLNGDRKFAMVDLVMLAQYVSGQAMDLTEDQLMAADVNEDRVIDIHDVVLLNQWLLDEDI